MSELRSTPLSARQITAWRLVFAVYLVALVAGTHIPRAIPVLSGGVKDKVAHFSAYAVLGLLAAWNWYLGGKGGRWMGVIPLIAVLAAIGVVDEITQPPVGRNADILDWLADVAGILVGVSVAHWWLRPGVDTRRGDGEA